jgi:GNAT superfamily N-acetyltransferase
MDGNEVGRTLARITRALSGAPVVGAAAQSLIAGLTGEIQVIPARSRRAIERFAGWPATLYEGDPNYVQPIVSQLADKLTVGKDPFWNGAERELFIAYRHARPVGTIAAIIERARLETKKDGVGHFGWFECVDDVEVARALFDAARAWLRERGCKGIEGPYNPSASEEHGILIEGFDTRPALMEGHHKPYYAKLVEQSGLEGLHEAYAWMVKPPPGERDLSKIFPDKLTRGAARARANKSVSLRSMRMDHWDDEVRLAHELYNRAMSTVDQFVPLEFAQFRGICESFRPIVDPDLVRLVEVDSKCAGFALVLPDANEALQLARGRLDPLSLFRMWRKSKKLTRACFKILVIDPAYRSRGLESLLIEDTAKTMLEKGYTEADLSLTGEENVKINFILAGLGFTIYRKYKMYRGAL